MAPRTNSRPPKSSAVPWTTFGRALPSRFCRSHRNGSLRSRRFTIISFTLCSPKECPLARKTDSNNPADWLFLASEDLMAIQALAAQELAFTVCRSKLAEALEKVLDGG